MVAQAEVEGSQHVTSHIQVIATPTTLFEVIDQTVSAVIDRLDWLDEVDEQEGEDEAHFLAYVRWRVALVNDAALLVRALLAEESLDHSLWRQTQGLA